MLESPPRAVGAAALLLALAGGALAGCVKSNSETPMPQPPLPVRPSDQAPLGSASAAPSASAGVLVTHTPSDASDALLADPYAAPPAPTFRHTWPTR